MNTNEQKRGFLEKAICILLLNVDKFKSISFVSMYKELGIESTDPRWFSAKLLWSVGQTPEASRFIGKKGRGSYFLTNYGKETLNILQKRYQIQTKELADIVHKINSIISVKELREFLKDFEAKKGKDTKVVEGKNLEVVEDQNSKVGEEQNPKIVEGQNTQVVEEQNTQVVEGQNTEVGEGQ